MNGRVLVLNASYEPINVCTERRAVVMIFKGVARMEEHNGHMLHSARITMHAPSVIRLTEYIHIPFKNRTLSRKNILLRDHSTCQYCGRQLPPSELTLDHIHPRSRGGESSWDNLVACCKACNHRKADRTPEAAGMKLHYVPYVPNRYEAFILSNRKILADQMEFLLLCVPRNSRVHLSA